MAIVEDELPLVADARQRLAEAGLAEHIGLVEIADRASQPTLIVGVRAELRPTLAQRVVEALPAIPFRIRDVRIADGKYFVPFDVGDAPAPNAAAPVIVEPLLDDRPEIIQELYRLLGTAGLQGDDTRVIGSVGVYRADGRDAVEIGISARTPREWEPRIRQAIGDLPVQRLFWKEPGRVPPMD